jgi:hypothetical protein
VAFHAKLRGSSLLKSSSQAVVKELRDENEVLEWKIDFASVYRYPVVDRFQPAHTGRSRVPQPGHR